MGEARGASSEAALAGHRWCTLLIPALERQRQTDLCVSSQPAWSITRVPGQ